MYGRRCAALSSLALVIAVSACSTDPAATIQNPDLIVAAGKSVSADITVSGATPDSATQDTTLNVTINGSGFVYGATASWALSGVADSSQVRTNSTRFVNSRQLVANITISATATVAKWDIIVTAAGKKGGIGTEAFAIKPKGNVDIRSRVNYVIEDQVDVNGVMQPAGIRGDGRLRDGSIGAGAASEYQGDFCGVTAMIFNDRGENGNLQIDAGDGTNQACGGPRYYVFNLNGQVVNNAPLHRVFNIWSIAAGQSINIGQGFGVQLPDCQTLMFNSAYGGDDLKVTRLDSGSGPRIWRMESQGSHLAACVVLSKKGQNVSVPTGVKYYLPFSMLVTEIPYPYPKYP